MSAPLNKLLTFIIFSLMFTISGHYSFAIDNSAKAPGFNITDHTGKNVNLSDYNGRIIVLEWTNPDCPFVQRHYRENTMIELEKEYSDKGVVWLAVNSTHYMGRDENSKFAEENDINYPILVDKSGELGRKYGAKTTPHMFIIDSSGEIAYQGAIDDDPGGSMKPSDRKLYVKNALNALLSDEEVKISSSKPYGCSVKYKK